MKQKQNLANYKGIYYADEKDQRYEDPKTGAHFNFPEMCTRLLKIQHERNKENINYMEVDENYASTKETKGRNTKMKQYQSSGCTKGPHKAPLNPVRVCPKNPEETTMDGLTFTLSSKDNEGKSKDHSRIATQADVYKRCESRGSITKPQEPLKSRNATASGFRTELNKIAPIAASIIPKKVRYEIAKSIIESSGNSSKVYKTASRAVPLSIETSVGGLKKKSSMNMKLG